MIGKKINQNHPRFKDAWDIYRKSFPIDEQRSLKDQMTAFEQPNYSFCCVVEEREVLGIVAYWQILEYIFVEHFAVRQDLRGKGIGEKILKNLIDKYPDFKFILEADIPVNGISRKRIKFYESVGFNVNEYEYAQPPYDPTKKVVPMKILTYPEEIDKKSFEEIKQGIYEVVYLCRKKEDC